MIQSAAAKKLVDDFFAADRKKTAAASEMSAAILDELRRIISSSAFQASDRNRRFLAYIVEETLAGNADRIKGYCIATDVFGRDENFDPNSDPVVRMEARRLRRALEHFYLIDEATSAVVISLPKGGYVPQFRTRPQPVLHAPLETILTHDLSIVVAAFDLEDFSEEGQAKFGDAFTRQLAVQLSNFPELKVSAACLVPGYVMQASSHLLISDADLVISGNIVVGPAMWNGNAILLDVRTGRVLWAESFEGHAADDRRIGERNEVVDGIVLRLVETIAHWEFVPPKNSASGREL